MPTRREVIAATLIALPLGACAGTASADTIRGPLAVDPDFADLVRFATLAMNGHNTQPWRFAARVGGATIAPDPLRRTPVVDPDDHHLFVSLGAAAETFAIASTARGRPADIAFAAGRVRIDSVAGAPAADPLFAAIPLRQSTRSAFDGRAVGPRDLDLLAASARRDGVSMLLLTDAARRDAVTDFVVAGNGAQLDDPRFVAELRDWVRFDAAQAHATGDGLWSRCSGRTQVPPWLGRALFTRLMAKDADNATYVAQIRSSAGIAVFTGDRADPDHWVRVGRSITRFALQATALGIRTAMINQPVEVPAVRAEFARWLGAPGARPDIVLRFGRAPALPMSWRRPPAQVIDRSNVAAA